MNGDPFPFLFSSIRLTTRSFFTARATRESEKHKKEEGDDTAPFHFLSLCDGGGAMQRQRQPTMMMERAGKLFDLSPLRRSLLK